MLRRVTNSAAPGLFFFYLSDAIGLILNITEESVGPEDVDVFVPKLKMKAAVSVLKKKWKYYCL